MKVKDIIEKNKFSAKDIIQVLDYNKFIYFLQNEESSWKDFIESEIFTVEYRDLVNSEIYKDLIKEMNSEIAYRKNFGEKEGLVIAIELSEAQIKEIALRIRSGLILSGYSHLN